MAYVMMKMVGVPQYDQSTDTHPPKQEMRERSRAVEYDLPGWPTQLSLRGIELPETLFPERATLKGRARTPPHFINMWMYHGVSEIVRDVIDALEPNVHQLVPVPVYLKSGDLAPMRYWALNICNLVTSCVEFERDMDHFISMSSNGQRLIHPKASSKTPIYIRRNAVAGFHLFRSREVYHQMVISDEFKKRLDASKIKGMRFFRCDEV
jgi:hypothetical protein